jgi:hypothetical protein
MITVSIVPTHPVVEISMEHILASLALQVLVLGLANGKTDQGCQLRCFPEAGNRIATICCVHKSFRTGFPGCIRRHHRQCYATESWCRSRQIGNGAVYIIYGE